jgi:NAD(P)-dependent dehydrogenase (short-subunit alcohol dehydrogenase family)
MVVTGGSSGVGGAIVKYFTQLNWDVHSLSRATSTDITKYHEVERYFNCIHHVDILINNAGIFQQKPFIDFTKHEIDNIIATNLTGAIYCTLQALPRLTPGARIINISSVSALAGIKNQAVYSASKAGLTAFGQTLGQEGYRVTTIHAGGILTPLWNEQNPYQGSMQNLLKPQDIVDVIQHIVNLPDNAVLKELTIFPQQEWH